MIIEYEVLQEGIGQGNSRCLRRDFFEVKEGTTRFAIGRQIKARIGWSGRHCTVIDYANGQEIRAYGNDVVARFVLSFDIEAEMDNEYPFPEKLALEFKQRDQGKLNGGVS